MGPTKQQSSPKASGGIGPVFEMRVQSAMAAAMLCGGVAPCLPPWPIEKIKLQGRYAGFSTDDCIVFARNAQDGREAKLCLQMKAELAFTASDEELKGALQAAWADFTDRGLLSPDSDRIALVTGPLSQMTISHVRPLFEVARGCADSEEFFRKVAVERFISNTAKGKLEVIRSHIDAGQTTPVDDGQFWQFLKLIYLISYDFDVAEGNSMSAVLGMIRLARANDCNAQQSWNALFKWISSANPVAGTLTCRDIPEEIRDTFGVGGRVVECDAIRRLRERAETVLFPTSRDIGGFHVDRRDLLSELASKAEASQFLLVVGERGSGKSALVSEWAQCIQDAGVPLFGLRTEDLDFPHLEAALGALRIAEPISDITDRLALLPRKVLVLESVEKLLEIEKTGAFSDLVQLLKRDATWTVVASGRDYAFQQITTNFLAAFQASWEEISVPRFANDELSALIAQLPELASLYANTALRTLIASPKMAELAYRAVVAGASFSRDDGEDAFRNAVWREVIAKESEQRDGIHLVRRTAFVEVAVARAKRMAFDVPVDSFDPAAILALNQDNLLSCDSRTARVRPTDDVLEDWALDEYIDGKSQDLFDDLPAFVQAVGPEPAMRRAFRLWLHRKLRADRDPGAEISRFVLHAVRSDTIPMNWRDEVITAVLQGENVGYFLNSLSAELFADDACLLKRFCFNLRIACQEPNSSLMSMLAIGDGAKPLLAFRFLRPRGGCWPTMIRFLIQHLGSIGNELVPHLTPVLTAWKSQIHVDQPLPEPAREAGLLAMHLFEFVKDEYRADTDQEALMAVMTGVVSAIEVELREMMNRDILDQPQPEDRRRPSYVDSFLRTAIAGSGGVLLCKHCPDLVIEIGSGEWFLSDLDHEASWGSLHRVDTAFGLCDHLSMDGFNPPSGHKGPFWQLLKWHWRDGLTFILDVCNRAAARYAQSGLDRPSGMGLYEAYDQDVTEVDVILNDGTTVKQFCSHRLWSAYRDGVVVVPDVLQCALMALENWLITLVENDVGMEVLYIDILKRSNSVLTTSVLASVATGFPSKIGQAALPLLRTPEFFYFDMVRSVQERGEHALNWFGMSRDPMAKFYADERRKAALRPWRRKHLEELAIELQFTPAHDKVFEVLDRYRADLPNSPNDKEPGEVWRYRLHRMDVRGWKAKEDRENERVIIQPDELKGELAEKHEEAMVKHALMDRFMVLCLWASANYMREEKHTEKFASLGDALQEARDLGQMLADGEHHDLSRMYAAGIATAAAVSVRDHLDEMDDDQIDWAIEQIVGAIQVSLDGSDPLAEYDKTNLNGTQAVAEALPSLVVLAVENDEDLKWLRSFIAIAVTHPNEAVRQALARGIRDKMWEHDRAGAEACLHGALEYSRLSMFYSHQGSVLRVRQHGAVDPSSESDESRQQQLADETERLVHEISEANVRKSEIPISLSTHSAWHLLEPCLMIPMGAANAKHRNLLEEILGLILDVESARMRHEESECGLYAIPQELSIEFPKLLAEHLMAASNEGRKFILKAITTRIDDALEFLPLFLACLLDRAVKGNLIDDFWAMWTVISEALIPVASKAAGISADRRYYGDEIRPLRSLMFGDTPWQGKPEEHEHMRPGWRPILDFCRQAVLHPTVADDLARLLHYFPEVFMPDGLLLLAEAMEMDGRILVGTNTVYYLEMVIQRLLVEQQPISTSRLQGACLVLLDAMVGTGSSAAYFMRERLVSRRVGS